MPSSESGTRSGVCRENRRPGRGTRPAPRLHPSFGLYVLKNACAGKRQLFQVRQFADVLHARLGYLGTADFQLPELPHAFEAYEPRVDDFGIDEDELFQVLQIFEVSQPSVRDRRVLLYCPTAIPVPAPLVGAEARGVSTPHR